MFEKLSRRKFLRQGASACCGVGLVALIPPQADAALVGFLEGTWIVQCPRGHRDLVGGVTRNHCCETCGLKSVSEGGALVVCPDGHASGVGGITRQHECPTCHKQCRRD